MTALNNVVSAAFADAAWSPDGKSLAFGLPTGSMKSGGWPTTNITLIGADGQNVRSLTPGFRPSWSPSGNLIAFLEYSDTLDEGYIRVFDVTTGQVTTVTTILRGGEFPILAWLSDTELLYYQDTVTIFSYQTGQKSSFFNLVMPPFSPPSARPMSTVASNPEHGLVAVASGEALAIFERTASGIHLLNRLEGVDDKDGLAFSPNGSVLAYIASVTRAIKIVAVRADAPTIELPAPSHCCVESIAWAPDSASLIYSDVDGVHIVNRDGSELRQLEGLPGDILRLAWMPRGNSIILSKIKDTSFQYFVLPILTNR